MSRAHGGGTLRLADKLAIWMVVAGSASAVPVAGLGQVYLPPLPAPRAATNPINFSEGIKELGNTIERLNERRMMEERDRQRRQQLAEERRERDRLARQAFERAERLREIREREAQEQAGRQYEEAMNIERERLRLEAERLELLRQAERERKEAARIARFVELGIFGDDEVTCGRLGVEDQGSVRLDYARNGVPPLLSAWFNCEEAMVSIDAKDFTPVGEPNTLGWSLGQRACGDRFRLNKRPWHYVYVAADGGRYAVDPGSVNAEGKVVVFDIRVGDAVFHAQGDCRRKRIQLVQDGDWERAVRDSPNRDALDFACGRIGATGKSPATRPRQSGARQKI